MSLRPLLSRILQTSGAIGVLAFVGAVSAHETQCLNPIEIWVDQETGSNSTGTGTAANPYQTITHALSVAPTACNKVVIIVNPGVYSATAPVPETFPLVMRRNVSIQGTNALNTTIRGEDSCDDAMTPLILFHATQTGDFDNVFLDGINVNRGCVGIRVSGTVPSNPTIGNVFLSDSPKTGIDIVSSGVIHRPKVIHCTFAQNQVALINRSSADSLGGPGGPVPAITVAPASKPGLLNVLASHSSSGVDFYGIRFDAMQGNATNGFFWEQSSGLNFASSAAIGGGNEPQFFGFTPGLSSTPLFVEEIAFGFLGASSDLRINPGFESDNGSGTPIDNAFLPGPGTITWDNGTTGKYGFPSNGTLGDWDCEGYGNKRLEGSDPDMGADEVGLYCLARYVSFTTDWNNAMIEWKGAWFSSHTGSRYFTSIAVPTPSQRYIDSGLNPPGNRPRLTSLPTPSTEPGITGTFYVQSYGTLPYSTTAPQPNSAGPKPVVAQRTLFNSQISVGSSVSNLQSVYVHP